MSIAIGEDTIHFDDRPWSVQAYGYENGKRYRVIVHEDYIISRIGGEDWTIAEMVGWVKKHRSDIEKACDQKQIAYSARSNAIGQRGAAFPDGYPIHIW